jgi:cyclophilin family peptidyl-prolyl cis-trans isomerase/HEAT repeat protein
MMNRTSPLRAASLALSLALGSGCVPDAGRPAFESMAYLAIVEAEDVRPAGGPALETLVAATRTPSARLRAAGARALGRLERADVLHHVTPLLGDPDRVVRAEAANALAQAVHRSPGRAVLPLLLDRMVAEEDPVVRGVLARSLGRLDLDEGARARVARALVDLTFDADGSDAPPEQLIGVVLGMESFTRRATGVPADGSLASRLRALLNHGLTDDPRDSTGVRIRALAATALGHAGALGDSDIEVGLRDPAVAVRRAVASRLGRVGPAAYLRLILMALDDPAEPVRLEALRRLADGPRNTVACEGLLAAARSEEQVHAHLAALDALGRPCPDPREQEALLVGLAASLPTGASPDWHAAAHALRALVELSPGQAAGLLPDFVRHPSPFVRAYAAEAAGSMGDAGAVRALLRDPHANVRTEAARQLFTLEGRRADADLTRVLNEAEDAQLALTLAGLLVGTPRSDEVADAALGALERLSEARLQTLRDPRLALLELAKGVGDARLAARVEPFLRDYDAPVAEGAAAVLLAWTGQRYLAAPRRQARLPYPTLDDLRAMEASTVRLHMDRGGSIDLRLLPDVAPTNAFRLLSLAREGALEGLTFHRVVPNFVIQGGSPGANEYVGHGAHTRDEVGLPVQWEGTVGLSTRGRDTGDGQLYVNLVDNVRLDHDYTVFGRVTRGMEVVQSLLEGDVIRRVEVLPAS